MARIKITVRADSPLSLGSIKGYGGTLIETGRHIAGGQLRGAIGSLKDYVSETEAKEIDLLLGDCKKTGLIFRNCYLSIDNPSFLLPFTAATCKKASGLIGEKRGHGAPHGVADTLLMLLAYDRVARDIASGRWRIPLPFQYRCPKCGHRTEACARIVECHGPHRYAEVNFSSHRQTRVAINRARQTSEDGQLYSVQAIDEGSQFIGILNVEEKSADLARKWLPQIERIGGRSSRGFGRVTVRIEDLDDYSDLVHRVDVFNGKFREFETDLIKIAAAPPPPEHRKLFTINLRSDAILRDSQGLPTLRFDEASLKAAISSVIPQDEQQLLASVKFELLAQFTQPRHVSGWQTAWQLPKEVLLASQMGGIYVFATDEQNKQDDLIRWLELLERQGIGEFREDGYGQIAICDPFHLEVEPV